MTKNEQNPSDIVPLKTTIWVYRQIKDDREHLSDIPRTPQGAKIPPTDNIVLLNWGSLQRVPYGFSFQAFPLSLNSSPFTVDSSLLHGGSPGINYESPDGRHSLKKPLLVTGVYVTNLSVNYLQSQVKGLPSIDNKIGSVNSQGY